MDNMDQVIENANLHGDIEQGLKMQIADLELLLSIDEKIGSILNLQKVLKLILEDGLKIVGCDRGDISLLDEESGDLVLACARGPLAEFIPKKMSAEEGISGRTLQTKQIQMVPNVQTDPDYLDLLSKHPEGTAYGNFLRSFRSMVGLPLLVGDKPIGIFCAYSLKDNDFSERNVKLLETSLRRSSWVVHYARSHKKVIQEFYKVALEVSALLDINKLLTTDTDPAQLRPVLYRISAERALKITSARSANIEIWDEAMGHLWFAGTAGGGWTEEALGKTYTLNDDVAGSHAIRTREPYRIDDVDQKHRPYYVKLFPWQKSHVSVPLIHKNRVFGVISVESDKPFAFSDSHVSSLCLLAQAITLALEKIELLERAGLYNLEKVLTEAKDLEELCSRAIQKVCMLLAAESGSLFIIDRQVGDFVLRATTKLELANDSRISYCPGEGLTGWIAKHGKPLRLRKSGDETELRRIAPDLKWKNKYTEAVEGSNTPYLGVPLIVGQEVIGVIRIVCRQVSREFTKADEQLLSASAGHIAIAIDRMWLLEDKEKRIAETRQHLAEAEYKLKVRQNIDRTAATAENLRGLLETVLRNVLSLINCPKGLIRLVDEEGKLLILAASQGFSLEGVPLMIPIGIGIVGEAAASAKATLVYDTSKHDGFMRRLKEFEKTPYIDFFRSIKSMIAVPLSARGQVIGVIAAYRDEVNGFQSKDLDVLQEVANYAAVPISNAMFNELARGYAQMTSYFRRLLDDVTDEDKAMQNALSYALELTGCDTGHISVLDVGGNWLVVKATVGMDIECLPRHQRADIGVSSRALHTRQIQLVTNLHNDLDFQEFLSTLDEDESARFKDLNEFLVVPLMVRDVPYGVICLHAPNPNTFTSVQMSLMEKLGHYTSNVIEQSQLHRDRIRMSIMAELGNLSGFVAHEINTPLDIILKKAERLLKNTNDEKTRQKLIDIMDEAKRGGNIVAELLTYVRGLRDTKGKGICDVIAVISNALQLVHHWLKHKNIQVNIRLDPDLPTVAMGESEIKQVFFNLIRNAVDAIPDGGNLTIQTRLAKDGQHVELLIKDTGVGMPLEIIEKIFHPYFTTKKPGQGTGLGLSICRAIVRQSGGDITVESEVGKGSTFIVTFPIVGRDENVSNHSG